MPKISSFSSVHFVDAVPAAVAIALHRLQPTSKNEMPQIQHVADVEGHSERVWSLAWHPTAPVMASCSSDKSVRLVPFGLANSISSSEEAAQAGPHISFKPDTSTALPLSHTRTVRAISWSPNGAMLATASFDSTVGIWERLPEEGVDDDPPETRQQHAQGAMTEHWENVSGLEGHENEVKAVAWSGTGSLLATCGRDKSVWIWECTDPAGDAEFDCVAVLMDHTQDVKQVVWHPHEEVSSYSLSFLLFSLCSYACPH